ncbi:hypothetical protein ACH419_26605 [Streptomyces bobili]|uniref:hypothetical protein n=1 Tax=Streptomyces bobili TaxID=67280 RepID=UPI0037881894
MKTVVARVTLSLAVLQALGLVPIIRRLRGSDSSVRFNARHDRLNAVGSLLIFGGLMLAPRSPT